MTSATILFYVLIQAVFFAVIGSMIGKSKGRTGSGLLWGLLLGIVGVIIIAVMPPTKERQSERNKELAGALISASGGQPLGGTGSWSIGQGTDFRKEAIAEAILRDPSLRDASDAESLRRLGSLIEEIQAELRLKAELDSVHQADEKKAQWKAQVLAGQEKANQRTAQLDAMPPFLRWVSRNRRQLLILGGLVLLVLLGWLVLVR
jgi:hypothetical protein